MPNPPLDRVDFRSVPEPVFAVTMGDPAGIGPDIAIEAWRARSSANLPPFFLVADPGVIRVRAALLSNEELPIALIAVPGDCAAAFDTALPVLPLTASRVPVAPGSSSPDLAPSILESIAVAAGLAFRGEVAGMITNPIAKNILMASGFRHAGHTGYLGELAQPYSSSSHPTPVMLMASPRLNVVPVTVHIPLEAVPQALTGSRIRLTAEIVARDFGRYFGNPAPRLAFCGLNPHAGESGELGREEIDLIAPVVAELSALGFSVSGPHPADTLFHAAARETYDVAIAMYHDQALIPFKTLSFEDGVNVTLGLPLIRTSPDHGTAFSLAGSGKASPTSFMAALKLAALMHRNVMPPPPGTGL